MKKLILWVVLLAMLTPITPASGEDEAPRHGLGHKLLLYIPNRVLDIFDLVRVRLRVGPGLALGVRVTEPLSVYAGAYASLYAGLPGPRQRPTIPIPVGAESYNGAALSFLNLATGVGLDPDYSPTEIGASVHLLIVGADVDVDPMEAVDLLAGFFLLDPRGDDF